MRTDRVIMPLFAPPPIPIFLFRALQNGHVQMHHSKSIQGHPSTWFVVVNGLLVDLWLSMVTSGHGITAINGLWITISLSTEVSIAASSLTITTTTATSLRL